VPVPVTLTTEDLQDALPLPPRRPNLLVSYWRKAGFGSLLLSLLVHLGLLVAGSILVITTVGVQKQPVDFLPGGKPVGAEAASQRLSEQVKMRKRSLLNHAAPMQKIVSTSTGSAIALSDVPLESIDVPEMSSLLGRGMSASFSPAGFGDGFGPGSMAGRTFKPITIFGNELKVRSIAVLMDVSGSMTPHLTKVIKELDKVAKGSPVVLYVGCGVMPPPQGKRLSDDAIETFRQRRDPDRNFELFWRRSHNKQGAPPPTIDSTDPVPEQAVYEVMANRAGTYFVRSQGIQYAWISLLVSEVRKAEALYWFSDFQDAVDDEQLESVLKNLKRRHQKLFIHASVQGRSFEKVRDQLCLPSGGSVISESTGKK
jgi:hypothetical protein